MQFYEKPIPDYLTRKGNLIRLVIFTAVFALAFINIYDPFGVDSYLELSGIMMFLYSSFVILTGMLVVVVSRVIMYDGWDNHQGIIRFQQRLRPLQATHIFLVQIEKISSSIWKGRVQEIPTGKVIRLYRPEKQIST